MAGPQDDGWETITDPSEVPAEIRKTLGVAGVRAAMGISGGGSGKVSEGERKTAFLATRLAGNLQTLAAIPASEQNPSWLTETVRAVAPASITNAVTGENRQRVEAAQADILDAALTLGTGAAYTKEQLEGYRKAYFPQLGDGEKTLADKRKRLETLLLSARVGAGEAAPQIDAALKKAGFTVPGEQAKGGDRDSGTAGAVVDGSGAPPAGPTPPSQNRDAGGTVQFGDEGPQMQAMAGRFTDAQWQQFQQAAMSGASAEKLAGMSEAFGAKPDAQSLANIEGIAKFYADPKNRKIPLGVDYSRGEVKAVDAGDGVVGAAARGGLNALTLGFGDEIGAVADTVTQGGTYAENVDRRRGYDLYDEENSPIARFAGQVVGGLPLGALNVAGAAQAARTAGIAAVRAGLPAAEARALSTRILASRNALEAAGLSAAYGFGDADGGLGDRVIGAGIGGVVGGLTGGAATYAGSRFSRAMAQRRASRPTPPPTDGQEVLAAMERQGVTPFPADVAGSSVRRATSAVAQTIPGASPIIRGAQTTVDTAQAARDRVAAGIGASLNAEGAGETARQGARTFIAQTGQRIGRIYERAEAAAGQARVETPEALRILNQELPALEEAPIGGAGIATLQGLRDALAQPQTVRGLRNLRTTLRDEFQSAGLRGSNIERIANRVVDAAGDDIVTGLRAQGLDAAARQYRVADRMWRDRLQTIDDHLEPILGRNDEKSGEQIVAGLKAAMAGNNRRFVGFINALPENEQRIVRASLISRMGQATKGQQDETGERFSLATFLTNWNDIGETAKQRLFGQEGRAALNDLARIASSAKEAQRFANFSNTGGVVGNLATAASGVAGIQTLGTTLALQYGAGRLLASPRFARWLARPPRHQTPEAAREYVARLSRIARAEPAIANDVLALQSRLSEAFGSAPARLAADERRDRGGVADRQNGQQQPEAKRAQP